MAFEPSVALKDCRYSYHINPTVKKFTLRDNTFEVTKAGHYQLSRILEEVPNSNQGFLLKIIINSANWLGSVLRLRLRRCFTYRSGGI